ncbi:MAG: peptidylprolyl isomerase [Proteobacteria bacterium]|uniref:Peptidyl-prolyl cis-trans isomerase n=1 Tax=Candidatus Avisuccinivibrio stercorigallinarum TaxID=2840704 RepID=A0A9D9DCN4_9GAMM|nr:peptidylprolyl isomerase [Candidatus Avisuccinivibrio stercorigallinarum]
MKISRDTVATVAFTVTDESGKVVGRTDPKHPVECLVGRGSLVSGLEKAIDGHEKGDSFTVTLNPAEAYGVTDPSLIQEIDRAMFGDFEVQVGNVFEADTAGGRIGVVVKEIKEHTVVVDGNHPLSGKTLTFLVSIEDVREATPEEKAHGHVHHNGRCPSEDGEHEHHCCCGHHHHDEEGEEGGHHCCHHHHDEDGEEGEHHCCHHHDGDGEEGEHHCCHHHDGDGDKGEGHHCCGHHHHDEDGEAGEEGGHHCCCGRHQHGE